MYDYFRELGRNLTADELTNVFGIIALLNEQPECRDWLALLSASGVEGFLVLSKYLGGRSFRIPTLYEILLVYAALSTIELEKRVGYEAAKQDILGGLVLDGFDELVNKIKSDVNRVIEESDG